MKNLTQTEEQQLEALLAKKEAGEKLEEQVQKAVEHINYEQSRLDSEIASAAHEADQQERLFNILNKADSTMFKLVGRKKQLERKLFPEKFNYIDQSKKKEFTPEQEKAAFAHLEMISIPSLYAEVDVYHVEVMGLEQTPGNFAYVQYEDEFTGGSSHRIGRPTGKMKMKLSTADYNERWVKRPASLVKKINEAKQKIIDRKEAQTTAQRLNADAIVALQKEFPDAEVAVEVKYKSSTSYNRRSNGYNYNVIRVQTGNLTLDFRYRRMSENGLISYSLESHNFSLFAAINAGNNFEGMIDVLRGLKTDLDNSKED